MNMSFDGVIASVVTGAADIAVAAITVTEERMQSVNFTTPYFQTALVAIVQYGSDIVELEQLEYASIAVQLGTTSDIMLDWFLPYATVERFRNAPDTVLALTSGQVDAIVIDRGVAEQFMGDVSGLRILEQTLAYEEYAIAVNRDDAELLARLNEALYELMENGHGMRNIYDMFFGGEE
ncbi:MAG: transporter substrate-binding domain-containing protein, partial [Defluviitaleaceae bacterium]|nr:transporter substrate-binding domain-containing protein [Defluviitaleaceae bacterium]